MQGKIIKAFLASVGFKADDKSLKTALAKVTAFAVGVKVVSAGVQAALVKVANAEEQIARQAQNLGTTTDALQEQAYIAKQYGLELDTVTGSMEALLSKNPRIKDSARALEEVGNRLKGMSREQQRIFVNGLGIDESLIPMLTADVSNLREEYRAMYAVANVDGKRAADASRSFLAEVRKLVALGALLAKAVAVPLMESLRPQIEHIRKVVFENFDTIRDVLERVMKAFLSLSNVVGAVMYRIIQIIKGLIDTYNDLDDEQKRLVIGILGLIAVWKLLNLGFLASPLGIIIGLIIALFIAIDDLFTYLDGGKAKFGDFWDAAIGKVDAVKAKLQAVKDWFADLIASVKRKIAELTDYLPDWLKEKMGISIEADGAETAANNIANANNQLASSHITPSPATAAAISNDNSRAVTLNSSTNISVQSPDPVSAGNQVARHEERVNAEAMRNLQAVAG